MTEEPYLEQCSICRSPLYSANECHNANPYNQGFCCVTCYYNKVKTMKEYSIIRFYQDPDKLNEVVKTGVTLEEAQEWCSRDDTKGKGWFDGYKSQVSTLEMLGRQIADTRKKIKKLEKKTTKLDYSRN
jgi:hypothetical protein